MEEISVEELARRRAGPHDLVLLDVREPDEIAAASIPGALHVRMAEIPARMSELDPSAEIAVLCHMGGRSEYVARFLRAHGFQRVYNVEGGIDAYSQRVDSTIPRY